MNIVLVNHYAGAPAYGMEFRPFYLAREWVRLGHTVHIVACAPSHYRAQQPPMQGQPQRDETIEGVHYHWLASTPYQGNGWGRLRNILGFLWALWRRRALLGAWRPHLIIASSTYPFDALVVAALARACRCPWVWEVHDLWPLSLIELGGLSPSHPFVRGCAWAERWAARRAPALVSMLPKVEGHFTALGMEPSRLRIVPNGFPADEAQAAPPPLRADVQATLDAARQAGQAVVVYAGAMGKPNALDTLLDAAAQWQHRSIALLLVGDGHERERLQQRLQQEGLHSVHWHPPIPKAQVATLLAQADVAFIGWQRSPLYRFGIAPNKLMDYMVAGVPVLHAVEAGNDPVAEAQAGLTVPPGDPQAVVQGLLQLLALPARQRQAMGQRGREFVLQHHAYAVLARRFLDELPWATAETMPR